ncbi:ABC transporter ATP-binding protein [Bifidobacterium sp. 64T4]|uniref:ABC transporter ATP-binding protein n=1 Tax=Bifidobacterium pongonis TaxID=2834432 RepID=UPI001C58D162|nr:ABC transporter ATP-binding protein [Bifidobacterium pongonis]MBW3094812.1 ABC transporter ATP-binding protein [Bifidobacterium pongonis]
MSDVLLRGRGIDKWFGSGRDRRQVLFGVDVDVREGECLAIIGASGSGKSTLTRVLFGLEQADAGVIEYRGSALAHARASQVSRTLRGETGLVFQDPSGSLDPRWRVARSVAEPLRLRHKGMPEGEIAAKVNRALRMVGLEPDVFASRYPADLSGGQTQRVAIARAIVDDPRLILADEPMSAIDVAARVLILDAFAAIREANPSMSLVMVSHDLGVVRHIADRIVVLHEGRVEESGTTADILEHPRSAYTRSLIEAASL